MVVVMVVMVMVMMVMVMVVVMVVVMMVVMMVTVMVVVMPRPVCSVRQRGELATVHQTRRGEAVLGRGHTHTHT